MAGSSDRPDLGSQIVARIEPWIDLAEEAIKNVLAGTGLDSLAPPRALAYGVVALYVGVDLLGHLDRDDAKAEALLSAAASVAKLFAGLRG